MQDLLAHPAVHAGVMPLAAALVIAGIFARTRLAWLAIVAGYATVIALTTGFDFTPLTVSRKILLVVLLAPVAGLLLDRFSHNAVSSERSTRVGWVLTLASAVLPLWVFSTILAQRPAPAAALTFASMAVFVGGLVWLVLRLRRDGAAAGAAGLGLGLGGGIAALLSASLGFFGNGVALAAAAGALLLVQFARGRLIAPGFLGTLTIGLAAALFALGATMLAQMPWYALPLLLLVTAVLSAPVGAAMSPRARIVALTLIALVAACLPVLAAWYAASTAPY